MLRYREWVAAKRSDGSQPAHPEPTHWMGTAEAARYLGITSRTLYRLINEGQIPAYKLGRVIRLKADDLDEFLEHARIQPGTLEHLYPDLSRRDDDSGH